MFLIQRDIVDARDLAKKKYFKVIKKHERYVEGINEFMNTTVYAKRVKLDSCPAKHLSIADSISGHYFLAQIKWYYDLCYEKPQRNKKRISTSCYIKSRC